LVFAAGRILKGIANNLSELINEANSSIYLKLAKNRWSCRAFRFGI